jgi:ATP-dependent Clp protease protease subunit
VAPQAFIRALLAIDAKTIHLRINSPGGDVFAARVIEQAIRETKARVIAHIDGYAASAASYVALAADEVVIAAGGFLMIHKAWSIGWGNSDDLRQLADLLAKVDLSLADTYVKETGQARDQVLEWMAAETWFNADEALRYGFADRLAVDAVKDTAAFDLSAYARAPNPAARAPEQSAPRPQFGAAHTEHLHRRLALVQRQAA